MNVGISTQVSDRCPWATCFHKGDKFVASIRFQMPEILLKWIFSKRKNKATKGSKSFSCVAHPFLKGQYNLKELHPLELYPFPLTIHVCCVCFSYDLVSVAVCPSNLCSEKSSSYEISCGLVVSFWRKNVHNTG